MHVDLCKLFYNNIYFLYVFIFMINKLKIIKKKINFLQDKNNLNFIKKNQLILNFINFKTFINIKKLFLFLILNSGKLKYL